MVKVKLIDLFGVKFEAMENRINEEISKLESSGAKITQTKVIGDSLNKCAILIIYEN